MFDSDADPRMAGARSTAIHHGPFRPHPFLDIYDTKGWTITFLYIKVKYLDGWLLKIIME